MHWHEQSWPTLEACDRDTPVVIPLGSCEQHGRHLPVFVDTIQVDAIARAAEARLGNKALFLPTLWLGSSHHHKDFPGTISLPPTLYTEVIIETVRCIMRAGFRRIFLLNGHGGNQVPMAQAMTQLIATCDKADDVYLTGASWWHAAKPAIEPERHGMNTSFISHACEYETSLMLALRPDLVAMDKIAEGAPAISNDFFHSEYGGRIGVYRRFHRMTASGSMGKPSAATAAKGSSLLAAVTEEVVAFVLDFATWTELPALGPT